MYKRPSTMRNKVYQAIKENICNGIYRPGQQLHEEELARQLQVSRSPVREALLNLVSDGLAVNFPHRGVFVKEFTPEEITEIFDVRVLLESYAILHSVGHITPELGEKMVDCLHSLTQCYEQQTLPEYINCDTRLHQLMIEAGGNSLITSMYEKVFYMIQPFRVYSLAGKVRFDQSVIEHRNIVHSLLTGNVEEANRLNREHLSLALSEILKNQAAYTAKPTHEPEA